MPGVPYLNPFVQYAGFQFNYNAAFVSCAQEYGLQSTSALAISSFNTASISSLTVSSINGFLPGTASVISSFNTASISSLNVSSINGLVPGSGGSSSNVLKVAQINPLTIDSNSSAVLTLSAVTDPNVWWNGTSSFFKPTIAGYYFLSAQLTFNPSIPSDNELQLSIVENYASIFLATTVLGGFVFNAGDRQTLTASALHYFDGVTTNVSIIGYNDTSGNLSVSTGLTTFQAFLIGGSPGAAGPAGASASTISSFNTASISSATISSISGWSPNALSTIVGGSSDVASLSGSLWSYSKQAEVDAQIGITWITNATTPDAPGEIGTSIDTPSLTTSLWAYARQAEAQADTNLGSIQTLSSIVANLSTFNTASISSLTVSSINGFDPPWAMYSLTGATINATITNRGTGSSNAFPTATFTLATTVVFNVPPNWSSSNSLVYDGWVLYNFQLATSINAYWGVRYTTPSMPTPPAYVDILGSTTVVADALTFTNTNQVYLPVNIILPPTYLTAGGNVTLSFYGYVTTVGHYFSVPPVVNGRVGVALD